MQNIDFYEGNTARPLSPQFDRHDMEYFSRLSNAHIKQEEHSRKRASRIIFIIGALCIISFTTGIVVGLKFAGGQKKVIVDDQTYNAVKNLKSKVSNFIAEPQHESVSVNESFPVQEYPFVIKIGNKYTSKESKKMASYISSQGHTVIITKKNNYLNLYTGPYKSMTEAKDSLKIMSQYSTFTGKDILQILKRK